MFVFLSMSSLFTLLVFFTVVLYCTLVFVIACYYRCLHVIICAIDMYE